MRPSLSRSLFTGWSRVAAGTPLNYHDPIRISAPRVEESPQMSATIERPASDARVASPPDRGGLTRETLGTLESIERRLLWLSTQIIHHANNVRPNPDKSKVGGHQASSASVATILTALYFSFLRPGDRVSIKPHASPVFHAAQYLLDRLDRSYLTTLRAFGGLQAYPSRTKDPDP